MKNGKRKLLLSLLLFFAFALGVPQLPEISEVQQIEAAQKPSINKKKVTLKLGKTATLKVKNASKKVKWSTSNKKIVQITSTKGSKANQAVVKGIKKGSAIVTAKVGATRLKAKITVKHTHSYTYPATCTEPARCSCGASYGNPLGHQMTTATCLKPSTCERCGYTEGSTVGHLYANGHCIWCNQLDLHSVISFTLSNTSAQGGKNVRFIGITIENTGFSEFIIHGSGQLIPYAGASPVTLYITDEDDQTYLRAICSSQDSLRFFYDTMDTNNRFTFLPGGTLTFTASYGSEQYKLTLDMYGEYTFVKL